jgi:hypothetical protein
MQMQMGADAGGLAFGVGVAQGQYLHQPGRFA